LIKIIPINKKNNQLFRGLPAPTLIIEVMKSKIIVLSILALLFSCSKSGDSTPPPPPTQKPIVWFFGDSMTLGLGASSPENRWTSKLCTEKNWTERNKGTSYETLLQASENPGNTSFFSKYQTAIPTRSTYDKYIFIAYGGNDCAYNFPDYTTDLFSTQLQTIITFANSKGWTNNSIVVLCGYFETKDSWSLTYGNVTLDSAATMTRYFSFIAAAQTVAGNNTGVYFVNPFNTYGLAELADGLHANDAGHAAIAAYVGSLVP
jgi:lysophospholipase L1-like esterase